MPQLLAFFSFYFWNQAATGHQAQQQRAETKPPVANNTDAIANNFASYQGSGYQSADANQPLLTSAPPPF